MEAGGYDPDIRILLCLMHRLERWNYATISAPHWRLYWNDRPGAWVALDGKRTALVPARFMVIPPNTPCQTGLARPVIHFYLHFLAAPPFDAVAPAVFTFPAAPELLAAVREVRTLAGGPRLAVLAHMLAGLALSRVPPERIPALRADERVEAARRLMEERLARPPANGELAERAGMNINAFIRLFRRVGGQSPQAWLAAKRVEHACLLLQGSATGIKQIAAECGFCDRYHFSRVFKRLRGVGPAEFRRRSYWRAEPVGAGLKPAPTPGRAAPRAP